jgi:hypothetical protein
MEVDVQTHREEYTLPISRRYLTLVAVLCVVVWIYFPIMMVFAHFPSRTNFFLALSFSGMLALFFGYVFLRTVRRFHSPDPAIIINSRGVFINCTILGAPGWILWEEVGSVSLGQGGNAMFMFLTNEKEFLKRQPWLKRMHMQSSKWTSGGAPVGVFQIASPIALSDLLAQIESRRPVCKS